MVGEARTFDGEFELLRSRGVEMMVVDDQRCVDMMRIFQDDNPDLWAEDIAEEAPTSDMEKRNSVISTNPVTPGQPRRVAGQSPMTVLGFLR
ncbi:hypothetical protein [Arthrobacter sp. ISL-28]|uniref:hypothetical protein n=1 Tax=Arthrobacter sp. ISL-28 TaxID=2819108 RepID=UPI0037BF41FA